MNNQTETLDKEIESKILEICKDEFYIIKNAEGYELAAKKLKAAESMIKTLNEEEKRITAPLLEEIGKARDFLRPYKQKVEAVISTVDLALFNFRRAQQADVKKQNELIQAQAKPKDIFIPGVKAETPKTEIKVSLGMLVELANRRRKKYNLRKISKKEDEI